MSGRRILRAISSVPRERHADGAFRGRAAEEVVDEEDPATSSRSPLTTGKARVPGVTNRFGDELGVTGMVRKSTSMRGVITSRSSSSLSWSTRAWIAAASGEVGRRSSAPDDALAEPREARGGGCSSLIECRHSRRERSRGAATRPRTLRRATARARRRRRRCGSSGFTRKPSAPLRRARKTSGRRSSSIKDGHRLGRAVGLLVAQFHADRHAAHGTDLEVGDHEVDAARSHASDDLGPVAASSMRGRALERGAKLVAQRGEVTREENNGHRHSA